MKQLLIITICCCFIFVMTGCKNTNNNIATEPDKEKPVEVIIEGGGQFPRFLVGKWKAEGNSGWEIVFDKKGSVSSAVIEFANTKMIPGKITRYPTKYGGKGVFEPGKWTVNYNPQIRELVVEIEIKHFYQDLGKHAIKGSIYYYLPGTVSDDRTQWTVFWHNQYKITALTPEPAVLEDMKEPAYKSEIVFKKVTDKQQ